MNPMFFGHNQTIGGASAFSDNFNRANNDLPGANWTEVLGDVVINSNQLVFVTGDVASHLVMFNSPTLGLTQYQKAKLIIGGTTVVIGFVFRNVADSGNTYIINCLSDNTVSWYRYASLVPSSGQQVIASATLPGGVNNGMTVGITVDGLGNNTVVRIWSNPTGLPSAADNWGGDTTPTLSFTQNPPSPSDAGYRLGLFAQMVDDYGAGLDDWFGGSL